MAPLLEGVADADASVLAGEVGLGDAVTLAVDVAGAVVFGEAGATAFVAGWVSAVTTAPAMAAFATVGATTGRLAGAGAAAFAGAVWHWSPL